MANTLKRTGFNTICFLTCTDPKLMQECPKSEQFIMGFSLIGFSLQFVLITVLLTNTLHVMLDPAAALLLAMLIAAIILVLEIRMLASDWSASGVLAPAWQPLSYFGMLAFRIGLAFCFAEVYGTVAELILQKDQINLVLKNEQQQHNAAIYHHVDSQYENLQQEITFLERQIASEAGNQDSLLAEREKLLAGVDHLKVEQVELLRLMGVEERGLEGRPPGKDVKYWEYQNNHSALDNLMALEEQKRQTIDSDIAASESILAEYNTALSALIQQRNRFDREALVQADLAVEPVHQDFLSRYQALITLHDDPVNGEAARHISFLIWLFIVLLELAPVLGKLFFSPPSLYTEKCVARAQEEAAALRRKAEEKLKALVRER